MKFSKTNIALNFVFLGLPFSLVRVFEIGIVPIFAVELFIFAAITVFAVESKSVRDFFRIVFAPLKNHGIALFVIGMIAGIFVADDPLIAISRLRAWIFEPLLVFALLKPVVANSKNRLREKFFAAMLGVAAITTFGFFELWSSTEESLDGRLLAIFSNANMLAFLLAPLLVTAVGEFFETRNFTNRIASGIFAGIFVAGIFGTRSYGAILGIIVTGIVALFCARISKRKLAGILAIGILGIGTFVAGEIGTAKFDRLLDFKNRGSTAVRAEIQMIGFEIARENPVLGIGLGQFPGNFERNAERILNRKPIELGHPEPHNIFLAVWLAGGIVALAGFLEIIFRVLRAGLRRANRSVPTKIAALALVATLVQGLVDTPILRADLAVIFWLLVFIGINFGGKKV